MPGDQLKRHKSAVAADSLARIIYQLERAGMFWEESGLCHEVWRLAFGVDA